MSIHSFEFSSLHLPEIKKTIHDLISNEKYPWPEFDVMRTEPESGKVYMNPDFCKGTTVKDLANIKIIKKTASQVFDLTQVCDEPSIGFGGLILFQSKGQKIVNPLDLKQFDVSDLKEFAKLWLCQMADEARKDPVTKKANESKSQQKACLQQVFGLPTYAYIAIWPWSSC
jgi:hypothetical protein